MAPHCRPALELSHLLEMSRYDSAGRVGTTPQGQVSVPLRLCLSAQPWTDVRPLSMLILAIMGPQSDCGEIGGVSTSRVRAMEGGESMLHFFFASCLTRSEDMLRSGNSDSLHSRFPESLGPAAAASTSSRSLPWSLRSIWIRPGSGLKDVSGRREYTPSLVSTNIAQGGRGLLTDRLFGMAAHRDATAEIKREVADQRQRALCTLVHPADALCESSAR
ncbi:hypothetical protein V8C26DRAFT_83822 [Trichoderma gracile]